MARDLSLPLREAIVTFLRDDAPLVALVPEGQIHGLRSTAETPWPFTRVGAYSTTPLRAQCMAGSIVDVTLHAFSKEPSEDECAQILAAMAAAFEGADGKGVTLLLEGGFKAHIQWRGSQIIADAAEADAWHGLARFEASIVA